MLLSMQDNILEEEQQLKQDIKFSDYQKKNIYIKKE